MQRTLDDSSQGEDVFPIPGTKRVKYLEQNVAAYEISKTLTKQEIADLEAAVPKHEVPEYICWVPLLAVHLHYLMRVSSRNTRAR